MTMDLEWLFDRFPDGVAVVGDSGRIIFANRAASSIFGFPDLTGMAIEALIPQAWREEYLELFKSSPSPGASSLLDRRPLRVRAERADGTVSALQNSEGARVRVLLCVPLRSGDEILGSLTLVSAGSGCQISRWGC
jgi:PAS domain S-box-containing protein